MTTIEYFAGNQWNKDYQILNEIPAQRLSVHINTKTQFEI